MAETQVMFNKTQFAKKLGMDVTTLDDYIKDGTIRALPGFKKPKFSIMELERLMSVDGRIKSLKEVELERMVSSLTRERDILAEKLMRIKEAVI